MRYIEKSIETHTGVNATCWVATEIRIMLGNPNGGNQPAKIIMTGWLDKDAWLAGKTPLGNAVLDVVDVTGFPSYEGTLTDVVMEILTSQQFAGGVLKDTDVIE
jgi:hypothetical protein